MRFGQDLNDLIADDSPYCWNFPYLTQPSDGNNFMSNSESLDIKD